MVDEPVTVHTVEGARVATSYAARAWPAIDVAALARDHAATALMLLGIVLLGFSLRLTNVNWDEGQHLHPDERFWSIISSNISGPGSVGAYFDSSKSPLNPYQKSNTFVYGTFPLFLNKAVSDWLAPDPDGSDHTTARWTRGVLDRFGAGMERPDGSLTFDGGYNSNNVGRVLSAIFDVFTIVLLFELGRVLWSKRVGLVAAGLLSLNVLHIQYSHFFGAETYLAFFVTLTVYFSVRIARYDSRWNYAGAGVAYGLALATKLSAIPVLGAVGVATLIQLLPQIEAVYEQILGMPLPWRSERSGRAASWRGILNPVLGVAVFLLAMGFVFRVAEPYAFDSHNFFDVIDVQLDLKQDVFSLKGLRHLEPINPANYFNLSPKFEADISALRHQADGADFPPNEQWIGRPFLIFPLRNMAFFGLGMPLFIAAAGGMALVAVRVVRGRDLAAALPWLWALGLLLFVARSFNPTMRYLIPAYPSLILMAAFGLVTLWEYASSAQAVTSLKGRLKPLGRYAPNAARGVVGLAVVGTFVWAMFFMGIYRQEISRAQASRWIHANIPAGSTLSYEEWDDGVPLNLQGLPPPNLYKSATLKPYAQDSPQKVQELIAGLDQIDYVVETSNRLYDSIPRIPARYPSTTLYYKYLFDGTLGFEKVAEFHNYPQLLGINVHDQWSEEAFTVYDHPKVTIWKKTSAYSHERALGLLNPSLAADAVSVIPRDSGTNALRLRPADLATQQQGGTWDDVFSSSGFAHDYPALFWLIVLELAAFAVTPAALLLFRRLPDRGYLLAKPLGLLLLAYPVWLIVSMKLVHFTQATIFAWLVVLLLVGAVFAARFSRQLSQAFGRHWRIFLLGEALFLLAFLAFYEFRIINPDLWHPSRGGEKPMDLAYLTAVTRSTTLPPYDPWFAGGYINYYYLGQFFTATLSKLTGIVPEVAFNLAVPTFFSLTIAGAFSVSYNLAATATKLLKRRPNGRPIPLWSAAAAGVLGALFVAVIGNLDGVGEMVDRLSEVSSWHVSSHVPLVAPVANSAGGLWQVLFHGAHLQPFDYWRPSRMMPPTISITEFPYFSFLFADLHAHMMAIPFDILAIGASAGLALTRRGERMAWREWLLVALLGLIVGGLRWENSWDYPPFLLLGVAAIVIGEREAEGGGLRSGLRLAGKVALLVAVSFLAFLPFLHNYASPVSGTQRSLETTPLHQYLAHFGVFLAAITGWLVWQFWRSFRRSTTARLARLVRKGSSGQAWAAYEAMPAGRQLSISAVMTAIGIVATLAVVLILRERTTIAAMVVVLPVVGYLAVRELVSPRPDSGVKLFVLSMLGLAFGLSMGVDLVTINGDIARMNTVFKFYLHIWLLLGVSASFAIWYLAFVVWQPNLSSVRGRLPKLAPRYVGAVALAGLIAAAAIYPIEATPVRLKERFVNTPDTLDGTAYMQTAVYQDEHGPIELGRDYEGIQWLRHNVQGTPVIMEASLQNLYRWGSRFSIYTGLPDVMGWDWHQKQQRGQFGGTFIDQRVQQVRSLYENPDAKQAIATLSEYNVKYVIVGQVEKQYYNNAGLAKFADGLDGVLEVAYENPGLTIYRVKLDPRELALKALR